MRALFLSILLAGCGPTLPRCAAPLPGLGCAVTGPEPRLIVYHRGWRDGKKDCPAGKLSRCAAQAIERYGLSALGAPMLVTGSSPTPADIPAGEARPLVLAAHSGGYEGLLETLRRLGPRKVESVLLLDCFYGKDSGKLAALAAELGRRMREDGMRCAGFVTPHNAARYREVFLPALDAASRARCAEHVKEYASDDEHDAGLAEKLAAALAATAAAP